MDFVFKEIAAWQGSKHKHAEFLRRASKYPWTLCILPLPLLQPHWSLNFPSVPWGVWGLQEPFQKSARAKLLSKQHGFIFFLVLILSRGTVTFTRGYNACCFNRFAAEAKLRIKLSLIQPDFRIVKQCYSSQYMFFYFGHRANFYKLCYLCSPLMGLLLF